jgi:S1-C subfamily serine protease
VSESAGTRCPRCGATLVVRLRAGEVCPDCASAEAWERYGRPGGRLVVDEASIAEALSSRAGKPRRSWIHAVPGLLALALSATAANAVAHLFAHRKLGPLGPLLEENGSISRTALSLGAVSLVAGIAAVVWQRRRPLVRFWPLTWCAGIATAAGGLVAILGGVMMQRTSAALESWQYRSVPPRDAARATLGEIDRIMDATVVLLAPDADGDGRWPTIGTGCVLQSDSERAWIATCSHVAMPYAATAAVRRPSESQPVWACFADGRDAEGRVCWTGEPPLDVALVVVEIPNPPPPVRASPDAGDVRVGSEVLFVPNPLRDGWLLHRGRVSDRRAHLTPAGRFSLMITSLPVVPGDSGSGLFDAQYRLVGLNTWRALGTNGPAGISLPSETIRTILDLIERGELRSLERHP